MGVRVAAIVEQCWHRVPGGTATATVRSLRAVNRRGVHEVIGVAARHADAPVLDELDGIPVSHLRLPRRVLYESWHRFRRPRLPGPLDGVDVVHATGGVIPPSTVPLVATVHDLAFLELPQFFTPRGVRFMTRGFSIARDEASIIVVPSEATAADCEAHGVEPERLRVVAWGAERVEVDAVHRDDARRQLALPERFLLFVGTREPRKNLDRLIAAHQASGIRLPLLVAGPRGWGPTPPVLPSPGVGAEVRFLGRVAAHLLPALYDLADVLVYPSVKEGFGLPVLEAMAQGTAAITSAGTATAEIAGPTGLLIDPLDTVDLAEALSSVVDAPAEWERRGREAARRASRFTWDATASALEAVYGEAAREGAAA